MREDVVAELEGFIERGDMWDVPEMDRLVDVLERAYDETGDRSHLMLAKVFAALRLRMKMAPIDPRRRVDVEAHVYQRLDKILEAVAEGLPDAEIRTRIEVFHRRVSRIIVAEDAHPSPAQSSP